MPRATPRPTRSELEILSVLWRRGAATVREVHDELGTRREVGYTTVLKLLQIMTDKALVVRDASRRSHVFRPAVAEEETQRRLVGDLLERAFEGSTRKLVMQALSTKRASEEQLAEIRRLLDQFDELEPTTPEADQ